jgi:hypothetical protein
MKAMTKGRRWTRNLSGIAQMINGINYPDCQAKRYKSDGFYLNVKNLPKNSALERAPPTISRLRIFTC